MVFTRSALRASAAAKLQSAVELINPHLQAVEERIREQARAFDPVVEDCIAYACGTSGKRLRPALALLAGGATGAVTPGHVDLAVILELIHLATLVHDDVMDGAAVRRSQPTANAKWGNTLSILLGDCLFAHALKLATSFPDNAICRRIAGAANEVCTGEIIQTKRRFDLKLTIADYFRIIEMKTAALFAAAGELGALISGADQETIACLKTYGLKLGTAYQVYDDCLDIAGSEEKAGKTLGLDLRRGKLTLPILYLLQEAGHEEHERFSEVFLRGEGADGFDDVARQAVQRGCLRRSVETTKKIVIEAQAELKQLPRNRYIIALQDVAAFLANTIDQLAAVA
ncbi:MAG: polyprenyl synthetase family protein [Verrucomicrobia bacterium]|nr:polyprenyl synthetase family protein [Verrucomicrobiota bacterium]